MADETTGQQHFWIAVVAIIILLIFLYSIDRSRPTSSRTFR